MLYIIWFIAIISFVLIILHRSLKLTYEDEGFPDRSALELMIISIILLLTYFGVITLSILNISEHPSVGNINQFTLMLVFPGFVYQLYYLFIKIFTKKFPNSSWSQRLLCVLFGFVLAIIVSDRSQKWAIILFEDRNKKLVNIIDNAMPKPCDDVKTYLKKNPAIDHFNKIKSIYYKPEQYVLLFHGKSIDIDGSTILYNSDLGQWSIFHNDDPNENDELSVLIKSLSECQLEN